MFNIGKRITELRKEKKWSQGDLAKAIEASRDMIGKYERGENSPSIEMAIKLADALEISVDYLLGKEQFGRRDKEAVNRIQELLRLDEKTRTQVYTVIDTFIRDAKTRQAYS
jgi:transcriptional regulator with XRE-family HTH domain